MPELSWRDAIVQVLRDSGEPMRVSDIAEAISVNSLKTESVGATPSATVAAAIVTSMQSEGARSPFARVSRGQYSLRELHGTVTEVTADAAADEEEITRSSRFINAFGMYWRRDKVDWSKRQPALLGQEQANSAPIDFAGQKGVYLLFDGREAIYVGRVTDGALGDRLAQHTKGRLNTRWDRFSWFGVYPANNDGSLDMAAAIEPNTDTLIGTMEALLIESLEPRQNRKSGDDLAKEYAQFEDPKLQQERLRQDFGRLMSQAGNSR